MQLNSIRLHYNSVIDILERPLASSCVISLFKFIRTSITILEITIMYLYIIISKIKGKMWVVTKLSNIFLVIEFLLKKDVLIIFLKC